MLIENILFLAPTKSVLNRYLKNVGLKGAKLAY
jgi:hypothetical protein